MPSSIYTELELSSSLSTKQKNELVEKLSHSVAQMDNALLDFIDLCRLPARRSKRRLAMDCLEYLTEDPLKGFMSSAIVLGYPKLSWLTSVADQLGRLRVHLDDSVRIDYRRLLKVARRLHKNLLAISFDLDELAIKLRASSVAS